VPQRYVKRLASLLIPGQSGAWEVTLPLHGAKPTGPMTLSWSRPNCEGRKLEGDITPKYR